MEVFMRFISVRDLRDKPAQIRQDLSREKELVLTLNGKPFAIVALTSENTLEKSLAMIRRIRAENAVASMQKRSLEKGADRFPLSAIEDEVIAVRKRRNENSD